MQVQQLIRLAQQTRNFPVGLGANELPHRQLLGGCEFMPRFCHVIVSPL
jgi:hypothetical protein